MSLFSLASLPVPLPRRGAERQWQPGGHGEGGHEDSAGRSAGGVWLGSQQGGLVLELEIVIKPPVCRVLPTLVSSGWV